MRSGGGFHFCMLFLYWGCLVKTIAASLAALALAMAGCQGANAPHGEVQSSAKAVAAPAIAPDKVNLILGDGAKLNELVAGHKGKVVLVDMWATWCGPCVEGFPHTVELAHKLQGRGLATIAVNFDLLDDQPAVRDFLAKQGADFENLMSKYGSVSQECAQDFDWETLPQIRLYDRQGQVRKKWEGEIKFADVEKETEALLTEGA